MSSDEDTLRRRYREFLELMPLTLQLAGLQANSSAMGFTADQLESRAAAVLAAYRAARQLAKEVVANS